MNGTHRVLTYADEVNLKSDNIIAIERNVYLIINSCKDICLAVNTGKC